MGAFHPCERWLTRMCRICALNRRSNQHYLNSWVWEGETEYYCNAPAPAPVKAAYAAKLAGESTAYDDLKKMCDGMLGNKDERWSIQTCLVRDDGYFAIHPPLTPVSQPQTDSLQSAAGFSCAPAA